MNNKEKQQLHDRIHDRYELYKLQGSRLKRLLKDPLRTGIFYLLQSIAYIRPFKVTKKTLWGEDMTYYLPEASMIYYYGFFEANLSNFFIRFLQDGDTFLDVGAHVGYYSMLASELVGEDGKVISFEPTPRTFESLSKNTSKKNNITIYNNAVLDKETEIEFFDYGPKYSAFNSFKKRESDAIFFKDIAKSFITKTVSIDSFCKEKSITPTFIKIDAEGSEYLILDAMNAVIDSYSPVITVEVSNDQDLFENSKRSVELLTRKGYKCYSINLDGTLVPKNNQEIPIYDNFVFIPPARNERVQGLVVSK